MLKIQISRSSVLAGAFVLASFLAVGCTPEPTRDMAPPSPAPHVAVKADDAPAAIGPYSQAVQVGDVVYLAGQIGMDPSSGALVDGGVEAQTRQALDNLGAVLKTADMTHDNAVRATVFLSDIDNFQAMNGIYSEFFTSDHPPARSTVQVAAIPRGALVEIDLIAVK